MLNYDPNLLNVNASQTVKLTFGKWDYRQQRTVVVPGNLRGFSVLDFALDHAYEDLVREGGILLLTNAAGSQVSCEDEDARAEEWLRDLCVAAEIIALSENLTGG